MFTKNDARFGFWLFVIAFVLIAGCNRGGRKVSLTGNIVENGQPIKVPYGSHVSIYFYPLDEEGKVPQGSRGYATSPDTEGSFVMDGDMGVGIPLGKYRITLSNPTTSQQGQQDPWREKFDLKNTPFEVQVDGSFKSITLDVGTGKLTTQ